MHTPTPPCHPSLFSSSSSTNMCSMHMPGCVGCVSALHVPAATRLQQHTPKTKAKKIHSDECTAWHGMARRKHPLERHTHTGMEGQRRARLLRRRCARCTSTHARTHARTHMQHTATGPGCEGKERRGKGGDKEEEKKKREGGKECSWCACIGLAPSQGVRPHPMPCPAPLPPPKAAKAGGLSGRRKEVR